MFDFKNKEGTVTSGYAAITMKKWKDTHLARPVKINLRGNRTMGALSDAFPGEFQAY